MKKIFILVLLLSISATMAFAQSLKHSTTNTAPTAADTATNNTTLYFYLGKINSGGVIAQLNHNKVSGFVKGFFYLQASSDAETDVLRRWKSIVGDSTTLTNGSNTISIYKPASEVEDVFYRYVYKPVDSTQKSYMKLWITPKL